MATDNKQQTDSGPPAAAGGERVRKRNAEEEERALTRCGQLPTVVHWRCVRCDRIACARCLRAAELGFEWLCPDCAEVLGGWFPGSPRRC